MLSRSFCKVMQVSLIFCCWLADLCIRYPRELCKLAMGMVALTAVLRSCSAMSRVLSCVPCSLWRRMASVAFGPWMCGALGLIGVPVWLVPALETLAVNLAIVLYNIGFWTSVDEQADLGIGNLEQPNWVPTLQTLQSNSSLNGLFGPISPTLANASVLMVLRHKVGPAFLGAIAMVGNTLKSAVKGFFWHFMEVMVLRVFWFR